jgi:ParB-like chromosome segregation protein Spo0J
MYLHPRWADGTVDVTSNIPNEQTPASQISIWRVPLDNIILPDDSRPHAEAAVAAMADSIREIGIQTPLSIDSQGRLFAGKLRFLGAQQVGLPAIDCFVVDTAILLLWRIAENFHREELSVIERFAALVQWAEAKGAQLGQVSVGGRGKQGGVAHASRILGVDRNTLRRAAAIAGIPPENKTAIRKAGLDDNQTALLSIAATPADRQLEKIQSYSAANMASLSHDDLAFQALKRAWENAGQSARARFITEMVKPYAAQSQSETAS